MNFITFSKGYMFLLLLDNELMKCSGIKKKFHNVHGFCGSGVLTGHSKYGFCLHHNA